MKTFDRVLRSTVFTLKELQTAAQTGSGLPDGSLPFLRSSVLMSARTAFLTKF